jgi:sugar/nucleoside kinase (ribokinase family)
MCFGLLELIIMMCGLVHRAVLADPWRCWPAPLLSWFQYIWPALRLVLHTEYRAFSAVFPGKSGQLLRNLQPPPAMSEPWWTVLSVQGAAMVDILIETGGSDGGVAVLEAAGEPRGGSFHDPERNSAMQTAAAAARIPTTRLAAGAGSSFLRALDAIDSLSQSASGAGAADAAAAMPRHRLFAGAGDDADGAMFRDQLATDGRIDVERGVTVVAGWTTATCAVAIEADGTRTMRTAHGQAARTAAEFEHECDSLLDGVEHVALTAFAYFVDSTLNLVAARAAYDRHIGVSLSLGSTELVQMMAEPLRELLETRTIEVLFMNEPEAAALLAALGDGDASADRGGEDVNVIERVLQLVVVELALVATAVVTLGDKGCACLRRDMGGCVHREPAIADATVVDSTGAGDAFAAAFLWCLSRGRSVLECCKVGCAVGAATCANIGALSAASGALDASTAAELQGLLRSASTELAPVIHSDTDYHVHLGGAMPKPLVERWIYTDRAITLVRKAVLFPHRLYRKII